MAKDTKTRQRLYRQRQARAGMQCLTTYLPKQLVARVDAQARARSTSRDKMLAELVASTMSGAAAAPGRVLAAGAADVRWLKNLAAALSSMEQAARLSKGAALEAIRTTHQQVTRAYQAMPADLRASDAGKNLSTSLGRLGAALPKR